LGSTSDQAGFYALFRYYIANRTKYQLARAVKKGALGCGAEVRFRKVLELSPKEAITSNEG
jgi:hypothetical protein